MNSDQIYGVIEKIAAESSKNEKVAIVKVAAQDEAFRTVLKAALNPLITYGIAKRPTECGGGKGGFTVETWRILAGLSCRALTGNLAINTVAAEMNGMTPESAELLWRIISKDLKAGFGESTVNKAVKGLIPDFPYMRCCLPKDAKMHLFSWAEGVYSQEKADGMFANINLNIDHSVGITGRSGMPFPLEEFTPLIEAVSRQIEPGTQSHGEFVVYLNGVVLERALSNGIMNRVLSGGKLEAGEVIHYLVWDNIPLSVVVPKGKCTVPYKTRWANLTKRIIEKSAAAVLHPIDTRIVHDLSEAYDHYRDMLAAGKEGVVVKDGNAPWEDRTSKFQVKLKLEADVDLKVTGIAMGKEGSKVEGRPAALNCTTSDGKLKVDVTVKNEAMRDDVEKNPNNWLESIIVVRANSILEPSESNPLNSLFLPRMVEAGYRTDKSEADSLQRVRDQFEAAMAAA